MYRIAIVTLMALTLLTTKEVSAGMDSISARCADRWPGDFEMRLHCENSEIEGARKVIAFCEAHNFCGDDQVDLTAAVAEGDPSAQIWQTCLLRWYDDFGPHYEMAAYCIETQRAALGRLRR